jgi:hypothetical protein
VFRRAALNLEIALQELDDAPTDANRLAALRALGDVRRAAVDIYIALQGAA